MKNLLAGQDISVVFITFRDECNILFYRVEIVTMSVFTLHPQLESDSFFVRDLGLCQLRLHNQKNIPWLILVPRRAGIREIYELDAADRAMLTEEIAQASKALTQLYAPDKINIGALGNIVDQLHIHVIARYKSDEVWPAPVWGRISPEPYPPDTIEQIKARLHDDKFWV
jgi:diadenosine tetraphosphate (Ap4A) HIT family hydrolase